MSNVENKDKQAHRLRKALSSLGETLSDIVSTAEQKRGERCPYRNAKDECTYRGGCVNRRRRTGQPALCGGDHQLKWK
jgi:hypothetical protein